MRIIERYFFLERRRALIIRFYRILLKNQISTPYLSGDAFSKLCDYAPFGKDGSKSLNLKRLRKANSLFVPGHRLNQLLAENYSDISAKILVCGNSDENFDFDPKLPDSVDLWLCQNYAVADGKGTCLPIGLENLRLGKSGFRRYQKRIESQSIEDKILVPPMQFTNPIREQVLAICLSMPEIFDVFTEYLPTSEYFELIGKYKYVFVLEGNGYDSHRLWEVLYKGGVPVMMRTKWSEQITKFGFAHILVDNFDHSFFQSEIESTRLENDQGYLFIDYWAKLFEKYR